MTVSDTANYLQIKQTTAKKQLVRDKKILLSKIEKEDENKNGNN